MYASHYNVQNETFTFILRFAKYYIYSVIKWAFFKINLKWALDDSKGNTMSLHWSTLPFKFKVSKIKKYIIIL